MPISITELRAKTATCDVYRTLGRRSLSGKLNVEYYLDPDYTLLDEALENLKHREPSDDAEQAARKQAEINTQKIVKVVKSWDLMGEDNKPVPISADDIIETVPSSILIDILNAIAADKKLAKKK